MEETTEERWGIRLTLQKFLTMPACPPEWRAFDLYVFADGQITFYVGQSYCAFDRVWEHIHGGPHGHSIIGRFVLANWPRSGRFTVELLSSQSPGFSKIFHNLDLAERRLIEERQPCFNITFNESPVVLPAGYLPPNAALRGWKSYKRMMREAQYAEKAAARRSTTWNDSDGS